MQKPLWFFLLSLLCLAHHLPSPAQTQTAEAEQQLLNAALKEKDNIKASLHSYNLGKLSWEYKNKTDAIKYLSQSISLSGKNPDATQKLLSSHLLGKVYFETGDYSKAADHFEVAAATGKKINSAAVAIESLILQAKANGNLKRYKKTIPPLEEALSLCIQNNMGDLQLTCYELLASYHEKLGNKQKADEYTSLHQTLVTLQQKERLASEKVSSLQKTIEKEKKQAQTKLKEAEQILISKEDSLQQTTQSLKVVEESLKDLEEINRQRQMEIDLLSKEKELADLRIKEQKTALENEALLRNFILAVAILVAALVIVVVINNRKMVRVNKKLDLQNKNIKSSINYAKRIQEAMLPKKELQEKYLKESFILFKPRDVVSGDFYWLSPLKSGSSDHGDLAFGAIDCTGHGVPGAFMSMIGINSLNSIVNRGITESNRILDALHLEIRNALQQEVTGNNDGMDAALCIYKKPQGILEFSGAKNPLVYIQNNEVFQIKGDIHPIGGSKSKHEINFKKHQVQINQPTMVYLFTDGFRDQFGGEENQKFMSKRFTKLLLEIHQLPLEEQHKKLDSVFEDWRGKNDQTDDVLILGVRLNPA
jgi:serine phosphatase RsbU (regulator of sigma subunit)